MVHKLKVAEFWRWACDQVSSAVNIGFWGFVAVSIIFKPAPTFKTMFHKGIFRAIAKVPLARCRMRRGRPMMLSPPPATAADRGAMPPPHQPRYRSTTTSCATRS